MSTTVKPIIIRDTDTDKEYTLEFNRDSIRFAESKGFDISEIEKKPMSKIPELFFYAFRMHHKNVSREKTDAMLNEIGWSDAMLARLADLYAEPFTALMLGEDEPKNSHLTVVL